MGLFNQSVMESKQRVNWFTRSRVSVAKADSVPALIVKTGIVRDWNPELEKSARKRQRLLNKGVSISQVYGY